MAVTVCGLPLPPLTLLWLPLLSHREYCQLSRGGRNSFDSKCVDLVVERVEGYQSWHALATCGWSDSRFPVSDPDLNSTCCMPELVGSSEPPVAVSAVFHVSGAARAERPGPRHHAECRSMYRRRSCGASPTTPRSPLIWCHSCSSHLQNIAYCVVLCGHCQVGRIEPINAVVCAKVRKSYHTQA